MRINTPTSSSVTTATVPTVALRTVTILLAALYTLSGVMKFISPDMAEQFRKWGYPDGFQVLIGAMEVSGAILLLFPGTAAYAAVALGIVMIGAILTHALHAEYLLALVPMVCLVLLGIVAYARRP